MTGRTAWILCAALALSVCGGCVTLEKSYPDKRYYVLSGGGERAAVANPSRKGVLLVTGVHMAPRYQTQSFVYRLSEAKFETDFYNQFLVSPGAILTEEIRRRLGNSRVFDTVIGTASQLEPTHVLESAVNALVGDFRDLNAPKAVLEMEFFLTREAAARGDIAMHKLYSKSVPVAGRTPEALVASWNRALDEILTALIADFGIADLTK